MSKKKPKVARLELKPTQVNTGFAQGNFDPRTGVAGYTLNPELAAMRDIFYGGANDYLGNNLENSTLFGQDVSQFAKDRFTQATQYDIPKLTADYYNQQQSILAPNRALEESRLNDQMFSTGRTGYGTGVQGGYINPQQYAMQMARNQQDATMLLGAEDRARNIQTNDINSGLGLFNSGNAMQLSPYTNTASLFGLGTGIEGLGMDTLGQTYNFANMQHGIQKDLQSNQQAINNAKSKGGFMSGLGGSLLNTGLNYATGGLSSGFQTAMGGNPFEMMGSSLGNWTSGLFSGGGVMPATSNSFDSYYNMTRL